LLTLTRSHKRLTQQKKQRERERKELDSLGRRQLANVRVVQRNVVYVVGIGPRFAKEEVGHRLIKSISVKLNIASYVANSNTTLIRIFWPIRQNLKDSPGETDTLRRGRTRRRFVHNFPPTRRCGALYRGCGWHFISWGWTRGYASQLWDDEVLYGFLKGFELFRPWVYEFA
jgi:hypothetical protein